MNKITTNVTCVYTPRYLPCVAMLYHNQVQIVTGHVITRRNTVNNAEYTRTFIIHGGKFQDGNQTKPNK